jgi:putative hemolysin
MTTAHRNPHRHEIATVASYVGIMSNTLQETQDAFPELSQIANPDLKVSYSRPEFAWTRRMMIRAVELITGQPRVEKLYREWAASRSTKETIFEAALRLLKVDIKADYKAWHSLPKQGPLLIVANHPFGVLDGLAIGFLATRARQDIKIMTHSLLCQPPEIRRFMLPVDFGGTDEARQTSLQTRRDAIDWLKAGHVVVMFPAGGVSTTVKPFSRHAVDSAWHPFVAKLAHVPGVKIIPTYFAGQNSRLFQIVSHLSYSLRLSLLFRESLRHCGRAIEVRLGEMTSTKDLTASANRTELATMLRQKTYSLADGAGHEHQQEFKFPAWMKFN